jgi:hypothetical protein
MKFEVFCDESGLEVLSDPKAHQYMAIGGIWIPSDFRETFKSQLQAIKVKHKVLGEIKWQKLSPLYLPLYAELVDYFLSTPDIRFRAIVIEADKVNKVKFSQDDAELSFYKFYYQLLHHWIFDFNEYRVFLDYKVNQDKKRLHTLHKALSNANLSSEIKNIQALPSEQVLGIQLADILTGAVFSKFNGKHSGSAKNAIIEQLETALGRVISPTPKFEEKFNVFKINLQGGW